MECRIVPLSQGKQNQSHEHERYAEIKGLVQKI